MKKKYIAALCGCVAMLSGCGKTADVKTVTDAQSEQGTVATSEEETEIASTEEDAQSWEITFDGIPWGTTFAEVKEHFPELELSASQGSLARAYYVSTFKEGNQAVSNAEDDSALAFLAYSDVVTDGNSHAEDCKILKAEDCDICSITFYFAFATTDDGYIDYNEDSALLYGVNYRVEGAAQTFGDIAERFRKLCGEPTDNYSKKEYENATSEMHYLVWENNDYIIAVHDEKANLSFNLYTWENSVEVTYAWKNGDKLLDEGAQALHDVKIINAKE